MCNHLTLCRSWSWGVFCMSSCEIEICAFVCIFPPSAASFRNVYYTLHSQHFGDRRISTPYSIRVHA